MSVDTSLSTVEADQRPGSAHGAAREIGGRVATAWGRIERFLVYAGDWLNPILVKETRQALKSFQFTAMFILLLIGCWIVTMGGVALVGPRIFYAAEGGTLMLWYYAILAFPLAVVVPYAAFRSLAEEREDNTYDLLSITTLRPRQIISGKLGSAVVQMAVYFSAITPCLAFTYLLRGIDLPTIAVLLAYLFFWSLGLSMIGILLATLTKRRFAHVFVSVAFVGSLLWLFVFAIVGTFDADDSDELFVSGLQRVLDYRSGDCDVLFDVVCPRVLCGCEHDLVQQRQSVDATADLHARARSSDRRMDSVRLDRREIQYGIRPRVGRVCCDLLVRDGDIADGGADRYVATREAEVAAELSGPDVLFVA